jgi:hypothetical protein
MQWFYKMMQETPVLGSVFLWTIVLYIAILGFPWHVFVFIQSSQNSVGYLNYSFLSLWYWFLFVLMAL